MSAALLTLVLALVPRPAQEPPENGESFALLRGLARVQRVDIQVPTGPCERAGRRLGSRLAEASALEVSTDPEERDREALRILVGSPLDPAFEPLARRLGVEPAEAGFRLLGQDFSRSGDALVAVFEDPDRAGRPLCLVLGNGLDELDRYLDEIPRLTRPHLWIHDDGELALECPLELDGHPRREELVDYRARRAQYFHEGHVQTHENLVVHARSAVGREQWQAYARELAGVQKRVFAWLGVDEPPAVELFLYDQLEDFQSCLGTSALSVTNRLRPRVHVLLDAGLPDDGGSGLARVLARELAGPARTDWIEDGIAVAAAGQWWTSPLAPWLARLASGRLLPQAGEVLAAESSALFSEHVLLPARAMLFQEIVKASESDPHRVRAVWKGAELDSKRLTLAYRQAVQALLGGAKGKGAAPKGAGKKGAGAKGAGAKGAGAKGAGAKGAGAKGAGAKGAVAKPVAEPAADEPAAEESAVVEPPTATEPTTAGETAAGRGGPNEGGFRRRTRAPHTAVPPFLRGLALVDGPQAGYSSPALERALDEVLALDPAPDAVSLTVLATAEDPLAPFLPRALRPAYGSADDLALARASAAARARGLDVLLSLEVLAQPSGAWADVISWTGAEDQERFAARYEQIALHYALLAELLQTELFSFGSNLRESVRTEPREPSAEPERLEARRAAWKALIHTMRSAFGGLLTFGARFPFESAEVGFYDQLDLIGLELYPRFTRLETPPAADDLRRALRYEIQQALDFAVRWNKPLFFLQLGFPARAASWERTWVPRGALDPGAQALYLETLADVLEGRLDNASTLRGFFLWNWPIDASASGAADFSLRTSASESALRRLFKR